MFYEAVMRAHDQFLMYFKVTVLLCFLRMALAILLQM